MNKFEIKWITSAPLFCSTSNIWKLKSNVYHWIYYEWRLNDLSSEHIPTGTTPLQSSQVSDKGERHYLSPTTHWPVSPWRIIIFYSTRRYSLLIQHPIHWNHSERLLGASSSIIWRENYFINSTNLTFLHELYSIKSNGWCILVK